VAEVYGAEVSKQTINTITDRVMDGMANGRAALSIPFMPSCPSMRLT
jgi:hypothetical protein